MNSVDGESTDARVASMAHARKRAVLILAIAALTIPAAYLHGVVLHRWGDHADLELHVNALSNTPTAVGTWRYVADGKPISDRLQRQLELRGFLHRVYEHAVTRQRISMLLLVAPSGPLVRHPPEVCYQSRANRLLESRPLQVAYGDRSAQLRLLSYESTSSIDGDFVVAYAFGVNGAWDNPPSPRLAYAGRPVLYKLQLLTDSASEAAVAPAEGISNFVSHLLPALNAELPSARQDRQPDEDEN